MDNTSPFVINGAEYLFSPVTLAYSMDGRKISQEKVSSCEMLINRLQEIKQEAKNHWTIHFSVDIAIKDKGCLSVGLGDNESVITWYDSGEDVFLTSLGDESAVGFTTYYFGDWTEMPNKYSVPWEKAVLTIRAWIEAGEIGNCINWV